MDVKSAKKTKKGLGQKKPIDEVAHTYILLNIRQKLPLLKATASVFKGQPAQDRLKRLQASLKQKADKKKAPKKAKNSSTSQHFIVEPLPTKEKNGSMGNLNAAALHKHFNLKIASKPRSNLDNTTSQNSKRKAAVKPKPTPQDSIGNMDNMPHAKPKTLFDASNNLENIRLGSATLLLHRLRLSLRRQQHLANMECQRRIHEIIYGQPLKVFDARSVNNRIPRLYNRSNVIISKCLSFIGRLKKSLSVPLRLFKMLSGWLKRFGRR